MAVPLQRGARHLFETGMRSDITQMDLYRDSDATRAKQLRIAAATALVDPHYTPEDAERRAAYYLSEAEKYEPRSNP